MRPDPQDADQGRPQPHGDAPGTGLDQELSGSLDHDPPDDELKAAAAQRRFDRWFFRGLAAYAVLLFALMALSIHASMLGVSFSTQVYGARTLLAGASAGLRLAALAGQTGEFLSDLRAELELIDAAGQRWPLPRVASQAAESLSLTFAVPLAEGEATVSGRLHTPRGVEDLTLPVRIRPRAQPGDLRRQRPDEALEPDPLGLPQRLPRLADGSSLRPYPASGVLAPTGSQTLYVWVARAGAGHSTTLRLERPQAIARSDGWGVAAVTLDTSGGGAGAGRYSVQLSPADGTLEGASLSFDGAQGLGPGASGQASRAGRALFDSLLLDVPPSQMLVTLSAYHARPGDGLEARVESIRASGEVALDLWYGDALLATATCVLQHGSCTQRFDLPAGRPGLYSLQAYRPFANPGAARDGRLAVVGERWDEASVWELVERVRELPGGPDPLLDWLATARPAVPLHKGQALAELLLSQVVDQRVPAPLLLDSGPARQAQLQARVAALRGTLHLAFGLVAASVLLLLFALLWRHQQRTRRQVALALDDAQDELEAGGKATSADQSPSGHPHRADGTAPAAPPQSPSIRGPGQEVALDTRRIVAHQGLLMLILVAAALAIGLFSLLLLLARLQWFV